MELYDILQYLEDRTCIFRKKLGQNIVKSTVFDHYSTLAPSIQYCAEFQHFFQVNLKFHTNLQYSKVTKPKLSTNWLL